MEQDSPLNRKTQEVILLSKVASLLNSLDLNDVLSQTLSLLTEMLGAERGSFFLFQQGDDTVQHYIIRRDLPPELSRFLVNRVLETGLAGWVYRHRTGTIVHDTQTDNRWVTFLTDRTPPRSVLCVPFLHNNHVNGIMTLEHGEPGHFTEEDLALATTVAAQAAISIRNAQLFHQAETHQRQLQAVLESTDEPLLTIDPQGLVTLANPAALALFGAPEADIIGRPLAEISDNPFFAVVAERVAAGERRFDLRDEVGQRDYAVRASSWRQGQEAHELGRVILFNDITTLKDLTRLKSQMLQMASHDLKNPLATIQGYANILLMDLAPDNNAYAYLKDITRIADHLLTMIAELLDLERIQASAEGVYQPFDPGQLLRAIVAEYEPQARARSQSMFQEIPPDLPPLLGEAAHLREAIANLIDNAIKYTPDNGLITVRASVDEVQGRFYFAVEDTGYGIDEELQAGIFQTFYRAKQPGTEHIPGTGLGLSLVKAVVERHGGAVWFTSVAGKGSTFGFWLPLPEEPPSERPA